MSRFLFFTFPVPDLGDIYPLVPLFEELESRGHQVTVRTNSEGAELLSGKGIDATRCDPAIEAVPHQDWRARNAAGWIRTIIGECVERAPYETADMRAAIEATEPDVVVIDPLCFGAGIAAELWGGKLAQYSAYMLPIPSRDVPPYGLGLRRRPDAIGRARNAVLRAGMRGWYKTLLPSVNVYRRSVGLAPVARGEQLFYRSDLVMIFTSDRFEYPRPDWPEHVRLVGPMIWEPDSEDLPWLDEIADPIVLVTLSTQFQNDGKLLDKTLRALADEDVFVIATTGAVDPSDFRPPANARVERFLPHTPILERASCVVCPGGMGIVHKALMKGVPICAVPCLRDQPEVARRVEAAGAGVYVSNRGLSERKLRDAVKKTIAMRAGAERMGAVLSQHDGAAVAVDALEELADVGTPAASRC